MTKYLRGEVNPFDVKTRITRNLARELGMTPDALYAYYETGEYKDSVTIQDVESWIKSTSTTDDLPRILNALSLSQTQGQSKIKEVKVEVTKPKKPSKSEVERFGHLMSQHFKAVAKAEVLSTKEAWQLFLDQDYAKGMSKEDLEIPLDVSRGELTLTIDFPLKFGATYGRCPITTCLKTMSSLEIGQELKELTTKIERYCCYKLTGKLPEEVTT